MYSVVYPLGTGSKFSDRELKISIKSLKFLTLDIKDIWIIGNKPRINLPHYNHIEVQDKKRKNVNIAKKVILACNTEQITDPFLYMYDDIIFLHRTTTIYNWYNGQINPNSIKGNYFKTVTKDTKKVLERKNWTTLNFETHRPMMIYKQAFLDTIKDTPWDEDKGLNIKSLYGNNPQVTNPPKKQAGNAKLTIAPEKAEILSLPAKTTTKHLDTIEEYINENYIIKVS